MRGGLFFQSTVDITTAPAIEYPRLVLDEGWRRGHAGQLDRAGRRERGPAATAASSSAYGALEPGDRLSIWLQFQVDPTNAGQRSYALELDDETRPLVRIDRDAHGAAVAMDLVLRTVVRLRADPRGHARGRAGAS